MVALYSFCRKSKLLRRLDHPESVRSLLVRSRDLTDLGYGYLVAVLLGDRGKACRAAVGYVVLFYTIVSHCFLLFLSCLTLSIHIPCSGIPSSHIMFLTFRLSQGILFLNNTFFKYIAFFHVIPGYGQSNFI